MKFTETALAGAYVIELDRISDGRGFFARAFCQREFESQGLDGGIGQANLSFSETKGTLRGLHFQVAPALESKYVRCIRGSVIDVLVDMRPDSPTYLQHIKVELNDENRRALYVPAMFAHGFQTLADATEIMYMVSGFYNPEHERGVRPDDPALGIYWPLPITVQSEKDRQWPLISSNNEIPT